MANLTAYGFYNLVNVMAERVSVAGIDVVRTAIDQTVAEHTRQTNELMSQFVQRTTAAKARYRLPTTGTLQPLDEFGNPKPVQIGGYYELGFPIQGGGTAFGTNRVSRAMMTVEQVNDAILDAQERDRDWLKRHLLAAMLDNASWSFTDNDPNIGTVTVKPLANNDSDTYPLTGGTVATDNHYLATASAIADGTNPFPTIYDRLNEHPDNSGPFVVYVPSNLKSAVAALTELVEKTDSVVRLGSASDTLTQDGQAVMGFGTDVIGYLKGSRMWAVEWKSLPSNYMIAIAAGNPVPALRMREYPAPELQGFFPESASPDGNLNIERFIRYCGFGVYNRTSVVVQQIGSGSYSIPTGYDAALNI